MKRVGHRPAPAWIIICLGLMLTGCGSDTPAPGSEADDGERVVTVQSYDSRQLAEDIQSLAEGFPQWLTVDEIGRSVLDKPIHGLRLGSGNAGFIAVGGHHAREWVTSWLLMRMLEEVLVAAEEDRSIDGVQIRPLLEGLDIWVIPMLNPDGVDVAIHGPPPEHRAQLTAANEGEADFQRWKGNIRGVNLNIQYRAGWDGVASRAEPHYRRYKGPEPESEPESRALADLVRNRSFQLALAYHATGEVIFWRYGQTGSQLRRDRGIGSGLAQRTGYRLADEQPVDTGAGFKDWFIHEFARPAYTIEVGPKTDERPLDLQHFDQVLEANLPGFLYAMEQAGR